ncbi:MAG: hypothetical protein JWM85_2263, partial [Acidimicrobiaceae bacterium]|nr:hypothetical protein [Acidimicrobiaceae bacterium]
MRRFFAGLLVAPLLLPAYFALAPSAAAARRATG